jgi:hypothetical protein
MKKNRALDRRYYSEKDEFVEWVPWFVEAKAIPLEHLCDYVRELNRLSRGLSSEKYSRDANTFIKKYAGFQKCYAWWVKERTVKSMTVIQRSKRSMEKVRARKRA